MKKIMSVKVFGVVLGAMVFATIGASSTHAVTPPDSCFNFNAGTQTITGYYNYEGNDSANPACPRDVDIPSQIGGVDVEVIGSYSFAARQLTAVTLPNTVTTIAPNAFTSNLLTSVTLSDNLIDIGMNAFSFNRLTEIVFPASLQTIGFSAFAHNNLAASLVIPASVTSIAYQAFYYNSITEVTIEGNPTLGPQVFIENGIDKALISPDFTAPEVFAFRQGNAEIVRIYAADPAFAAAYPSEVYTSSFAGQTYVTGAFIVNPASVTVQYHDAAGTQLHAPLTVSGVVDGVPVSGHYLADLATTLSGTTVDFSGYFVAGNSYTAALLQIAGYNAPGAQTVTLTAGANIITQVYTANATGANPTTANPGDITAPNTGAAQQGSAMTFSVITVLLGAMIAGVALTTRRRTDEQ